MVIQTNKLNSYDEYVQLQRFSFYKKAPLIFLIAVLAVFFVYGIVDACIPDKLLALENGFLIWLIWMLIGAAIAVAGFFILKVTCSYKILHIYYLQKLTAPKKAPVQKENHATSTNKQ